MRHCPRFSFNSDAVKDDVVNLYKITMMMLSMEMTLMILITLITARARIMLYRREQQMPRKPDPTLL